MPTRSPAVTRGASFIGREEALFRERVLPIELKKPLFVPHHGLSESGQRLMGPHARENGPVGNGIFENEDRPLVDPQGPQVLVPPVDSSEDFRIVHSLEEIVHRQTGCLGHRLGCHFGTPCESSFDHGRFHDGQTGPVIPNSKAPGRFHGRIGVKSGDFWTGEPVRHQRDPRESLPSPVVESFFFPGIAQGISVTNESQVPLDLQAGPVGRLESLEGAFRVKTPQGQDIQIESDLHGLRIREKAAALKATLRARDAERPSNRPSNRTPGQTQSATKGPSFRTGWVDLAESAPKSGPNSGPPLGGPLRLRGMKGRAFFLFRPGRL